MNIHPQRVARRLFALFTIGLMAFVLSGCAASYGGRAESAKGDAALSYLTSTTVFQQQAAYEQEVSDLDAIIVDQNTERSILDYAIIVLLAILALEGYAFIRRFDNIRAVAVVPKSGRTPPNEVTHLAPQPSVVRTDAWCEKCGDVILAEDDFCQKCGTPR